MGRLVPILDRLIMKVAYGCSHNGNGMIPPYRQKLKLCKPVVEDLQACFDCTDWDDFRTVTSSLDVCTEAVTSYISFCSGRS